MMAIAGHVLASLQLLKAVLFAALFITCFLVFRNYSSLLSKSTLTFAQEEFIRQRIKKSEEIWEKAVIYRNEVERNYIWNDQQSIVWDFFNPNFDCPHHVERIGKLSDGGKWMCGLDHFLVNKKQSHSCIVFSYGIRDDTSFEDEILGRTSCTVYAFDHTVDSHNVAILRNHPGRAHFNKIGIGANDSTTLWTLKTAMKTNNVEFIDILKVDVEASEYGAFRKVLKDFPYGLPFGQLLIEIHLGQEWGMRKHVEFKKWFESLEAAGLRAFHKEVNVLGPKFCCFEVSFLNVKVDHQVLHSSGEIY